MKISEILDLSKPFWEQLAGGSDQSIRIWIREDALNGVMQDNTSGHSYSEGYARYKANDFKGFRSGKRLKGYETGSYDNNISKVTMYATGNTINGLAYYDSDSTSVTLRFKPEDGMKVKWNAERGEPYDIWGLNDVNIEKVRKRIISEYKKNTGKLPGVVEIYVTRD